jgi:hypothetical protein
MTDILSRIKSPGDLVNNQGAKILMYGASMTRTMRRFRDLKMHVIFVAKEDKLRDESTGMFHYQPMMVGAKLPTQIPYFFDEVLCLRTFTEENEEGKKVTNRWLQTILGDNYIAKDRSGKLDSFEEPNLTYIINKLGFTKGEK